MILANGLLNILAVVRKFLCDFEGYFFVVEQLDNLRDQLHKVNACSHVTFAFAQIGAKPLHSHVGFVQQAHKGITLFNGGEVFALQIFDESSNLRFTVGLIFTLCPNGRQSCLL